MFTIIVRLHIQHTSKIYTLYKLRVYRTCARFKNNVRVPNANLSAIRRYTYSRTSFAQASIAIDTSINQAQNEYKHSLTFLVRSYVVIATKPVHRLQIRPMVHKYRTPLPLPQLTSGSVQ